MASFSNTLNNVKLTVTLSREVSDKLEEIARKKEIPRSQAMEEILRDWINNFRRKTVEKEIKNYYCSLSEEEKEEDKLWLKVAENSSKGLWDD